MPADSRVADLLAAWRLRRDQGEFVTPESLCRDCPELADDLRRLIAAADDTSSRPPPADLSVSAADTASVGQAPTQTDDVPQRVGTYAVVGVLGRGGMGTVLLADDPRLGRRVAVKVLRTALAAQPKARARFVREARNAAKVVHDHIVPIYDVDGDADPPYLVMPALEGETLDARLKRGDRPPLPEVLRIAREVTDGLAAAHAAGLVHRDIKPSNVWLEAGTGRVKLLDFGLARAAEATAGDDLTHTGTVVGTPSYMAPEQAAGEKVDHRADLFSLGVVLYELATGVKPFRGPTVMAVLTALATHRPPCPRELNPGLPVALSTLILELLAKDRTARPATAREVTDRLARIDRGDPTPTPTAAPPTGPRERTHRAVPAKPARSRSFRTVATVAAGLATLCLVVVAGVSSLGTSANSTFSPGDTAVEPKGPPPPPDGPPAPAPNQPLVLPSEFPGTPDLTILDPLPTPEEGGVSISVRSDKVLAPGPLAVVIDLSASMKLDYLGREIPGGPDAWRTGGSRFRMVLRALDRALLDVPPGTPISIRVFGDKEAPAGSRRVYPVGKDDPTVSWSPKDRTALHALMFRLEDLTPEGSSPLVDAILTAAREDLPAGNRPKTLVVLTDGVDQPGAAPPTRGALAKARERLTQAGDHLLLPVALHVFHVNLTPEERQLSDILFPATANDASPRPAAPADTEDALARAIRAALRPRVRLARPGLDPPAPFPRIGWPATDADRPDQLAWSPPVPAGIYTATAPALPRSEARVNADNGDRYLLGLSYAPAGDRLLVRRELYADFFRDRADVWKMRPDGKWVLTVPGGWVDADRTYRAVAFLEKIPGHLGWPAVEDAEIRHNRPALLWWEVGPAGGRAAGPVVVRRRYGYPAPTYEVSAGGWPTAGDGFDPARVRVWVADTLPTGTVVECRFGQEVRAAVPRAGEVVLRAEARERDKQWWLTVRVAHRPGDPVVARLTSAGRFEARHAYYRGANGYEATFGPFTRKELPASLVRLELVPIEPLVADPRSAIDLPLPRPQAGRPPELGHRIPVQTVKPR